MTQGGTTYYLAYDQVGSLRLITDNAGNSIKRVDYDSFGNIISDSNPSFAIPFGFAGGLHDPDTKLVRFGYRDYMPEIGKWTAKDPILFAGGDSNLYGYVQNDPINYIDPEGKILANIGGAIVGGIVGGIVNAATHSESGQVWEAFKVGAIGGAVGGFLLNPAIAGAVTGALTGYMNVDAGLDCGDAGKAALYGGAMGLAGGGMAKLAGISTAARAGTSNLAGMEAAAKVGEAAAGVTAGTISGTVSPHLP
jgi:RHS repeat-associated protein